MSNGLINPHPQASAMDLKPNASTAEDTQRLETLGLMVGGIAHDFNNLLTTIGGQASLALVHLPEDDPARKHIEKVLKASEFAAALTQQLLHYANNGQTAVMLHDLNQVIRDSAELMSMALPDHVTLELEQHPGALPIFVSQTRLQQIIINLILNAAESIQGSRGLIKLRTGTRILKEKSNCFVNGRSLPPGKYHYLQVEDNGVGMSDEQMQNIFSAFYTTKKHGRGLGLATILSIAKAHGGAIDVSSQPNVGTTFTILLPAVTTKSQLAASRQHDRTHS